MNNGLEKEIARKVHVVYIRTNGYGKCMVIWLLKRRLKEKIKRAKIYMQRTTNFVNRNYMIWNSNWYSKSALKNFVQFALICTDFSGKKSVQIGQS